MQNSRLLKAFGYEHEWTRATRIFTTVGIILLIGLVSTAVGILLDSDLVPGMHVGPSWSAAKQSSAYLAEKLFTCLAVGFMVSIVPQLTIGLLVAALVLTRNDLISQAKLATAQLERKLLTPSSSDPSCCELDRDGDGVVSILDLIEAYLKADYPGKYLLEYVLNHRLTACHVDTTGSGVTTYCLNVPDLQRHESYIRDECCRLVVGTLGWLLALLLVFALTGIWWAAGLLLAAAAVTACSRLKRNRRIQRFLLRELPLHCGNDNNATVTELQLLSRWNQLSSAEQENLMLCLKHGAAAGHEVKLAGDLTQRAFIINQVESWLLPYARFFA